MEVLDLKSKNSTEYLQNILIKSWVFYVHKKPQFEYLISNIQELINFYWLPTCQLSALHRII